MYREPFYKVEEFWSGLAIGLAVLALTVTLLWLRAWVRRRIQFKLAERVSVNFVVAGEIFRLLRQPPGSETHLTVEALTRLTASIESHGRFFANLLQDKQSFCLFFGNVFAWAFDDVYQIYGDFVAGCSQLKHHISNPPDDDASLQVKMDRYLRVITSDTDIMNDITYFRLSRAVAVIDTACRPILDERAGKHGVQTDEPKFRQLATVLTRP
jgi:hypothetical protein